MTLKEYIENHLSETHKSVSAFAETCKLEPNDIYRILRNSTKKRVPSQRILNALSETLNLSIKEITDMCIEPSGTTFTNHSLTTDLIIGQFRSINQFLRNNKRELLDIDSIGNALVENDSLIYNKIDEKFRWTPTQCSSLIKRFPDLSLLVLDPDTSEIVGDFSFIPLSISQETEIIDKNFYEKYLNTEELVSPLGQGTFPMYILNFSINFGYSDKKTKDELFEKFFDNITIRANNNYFFSKIYVRLFTKTDVAFFQSLGFTSLYEDEKKNQMMCIDDIINIKWQSPGFSRLKESYKQRPSASNYN